MMHSIVPNIWFEKEVEEAANFYKKVFKDVTIGNIMRYDKQSAEVSGQKEGSVLSVEFTIFGQRFVGINGGPLFKPNPSISFFVRCDSAEEVDRLWGELKEGGFALMELGEYPFSKKYGWLQDKYGVSWQLIVQESKQKIAPSLLFTQHNNGRLKEAIDLYLSLFPNSKLLSSSLRTAAEAVNGEKEGTLSYALLTLAGKEMVAMESGGPHKFTFTEGMSLMVECDTQEEIDMLWDRFTKDGGEESMCGWCKDKYGVSWQIVPVLLDEMLRDENKEKMSRAMGAMLQMKKLDIAALKKAYEGK